MDIDEGGGPPADVNLTACIVLNQRDDERLGFDFVSFPGANEVMGVIDLTPGAHFVYIKEGEPNEEIDRRLGEFVHIPQGGCAVLKRGSDADGPLFALLGEDESRSYHSALVAGNFQGKLAKVPDQLRQLWSDLTGFITPNVIRLLRPIDRKGPSRSRLSTEASPNSCTRSTVSDGAKASDGSDISQGNKEGVPIAADEAHSSLPSTVDSVQRGGVNCTSTTGGTNLLGNEFPHAARNSYSLEPADSEHLSPRSKSEVPPGAAASTLGADEDTAADYRAIVDHLKDLKNRPGFLFEVYGEQEGSNYVSTPSLPTSEQPTVADAVRHHGDTVGINAASRTHVSPQAKPEPMLDWETPRDQCTIYYSDLRKLNRQMSRLKNVSPSTITEMHLDTTHVLDALVAYHNGNDVLASDPKKSSLPTTDATERMENVDDPFASPYACVLGEFEYAFCVFLLNFHYVSFEQWKHLFRTICNAESFFLQNTHLAQRLLKVINLQLETFESDLYEPGNFFAYHLRCLEELINDNQPALSYLLDALSTIRRTFQLKFGISLEDAGVLHEGVQVV